MEDTIIDTITSKYPVAYKFLDSLLIGKIPDREILKNLYGGKVPEIERMLEDFWAQSDLVFGSQLRTDVKDPAEIYFARQRIENDPLVSKIDYYVHQRLPPPRDLMREIFEEFADDALKVYNYYNITGKKRECGIPVATHPNNLAMTGYGMGFDKIGRIGFVYHDVPEDLYDFLVEKLGLQKGLLGYDTFIKEVIPGPIRKVVNILTNKYDTIIENISNTLRSKGLSFNQKNTLDELLNLMSANYSDLEQEYGLGRFVLRTYPIVEKLKDSNTYKEDLKWACYINYIEDMKIESIKDKFYLSYDMKGVDLWFNGIGREALNMTGMIRNALKQQTWVNKGRDMKSEWIPLENHIDEVGANAYKFAKNYVAKDILMSIFQISHLGSALDKTKRLTPIFFEDVDTDYTIKKAA